MHTAPTSYNSFLANLRRRSILSEAEIAIVLQHIKVVHLKKREHFLRAGEIGHYQAYINKGCMRVYFTDFKGHEHVVQLGFELPANYSIEALEDAELFLIEYEDHEKLLQLVPSLERSFRILIQNAYISMQQRIISNMSQSAEERYVALIQRFPHMELRIAQHHIASYLGISPEALSRIRKALVQKQRSESHTEDRES
jgi:CRP-like cAMP-binding protein